MLQLEGLAVNPASHMDEQKKEIKVENEYILVGGVCLYSGTTYRVPHHTRNMIEVILD